MKVPFLSGTSKDTQAYIGTPPPDAFSSSSASKSSLLRPMPATGTPIPPAVMAQSQLGTLPTVPCLSWSLASLTIFEEVTTANSVNGLYAAGPYYGGQFYGQDSQVSDLV